MDSDQPTPLYRSPDLTIRRMRDARADYQAMAKWLTDERVLQFYEGRDDPYPYERVLEKYGPKTRGEIPIHPCLIVFHGREIGYIQYFPVLDTRDYELDDVTDTYGIDMFIGEPEHWGHGIGTRALSALVAYIFAELGAGTIVIDPHADNPRAIRSYEKCGFRKVKPLLEHELHEGALRDCWLMAIER